MSAGRGVHRLQPRRETGSLTDRHRGDPCDPSAISRAVCDHTNFRDIGQCVTCLRCLWAFLTPLLSGTRGPRHNWALPASSLWTSSKGGGNREINSIRASWRHQPDRGRRKKEGGSLCVSPSSSPLETKTILFSNLKSCFTLGALEFLDYDRVSECVCLKCQESLYTPREEC